MFSLLARVNIFEYLHLYMFDFLQRFSIYSFHINVYNNLMRDV